MYYIRVANVLPDVPYQHNLQGREVKPMRKKAKERKKALKNASLKKRKFEVRLTQALNASRPGT
jgi:hypothetical protein